MTDDAIQGTFFVASADEGTAVFHDVSTGQIHTLAENPGVDAGEVVEATIETQPPMETVWTAVDVSGQRTIPVERSSEPPTRQERNLAAEQSVGEVTTRERAGEGEIHVITVPDERTDQAAQDVLDDEATVTRAARLGANRVEVRAADGVLSVRYLP
jgi:hypothetical protein